MSTDFKKGETPLVQIPYPFDPESWLTQVIVIGLDHYYATLEMSIELNREFARSGIYPDYETNPNSNVLKLVYENQLPHNFRFSFVVFAFITVESRLEKLCKIIAEAFGTSFDSNDYSAQDGLEKCKKFYKKLTNRSLGQIPEWFAMTNLALVRNCIVHTNGEFSRSRDHKQLRQLVKQGKGIESQGEYPYDNLVLTPEYCKRLVQDIADFFTNFFILTRWQEEVRPPSKELLEYLAAKETVSEDTSIGLVGQ